LSRRPERIRSFVAVALPDQQRSALAEYLDRCRVLAPGLRWVSAANLHLTLRFLGSVEHEQLERLATSLRGVAFTPFQLGLDGLGTFGRGPAVRVAWLGVAEGSSQLAGLAAEIEARCAEIGLEPEERPYNAHLTLARSRERRGARLPELPAPPELAPWTVAGFQLYRSQTGPGGAVYSQLASFPA
jgi:2'-5' RNA ligase